MDRYVAFLRGMNLGNRRIKNEELRAHFEAMGLEEVATFRASGNVIFATPEREAEAKLAGRVEAELDERLGYDVPVFLRSAGELAAIAAQKPFPVARVKRSRSWSGPTPAARWGRWSRSPPSSPSLGRPWPSRPQPRSTSTSAASSSSRRSRSSWSRANG
jgi:hypothetical protein